MEKPFSSISNQECTTASHGVGTRIWQLLQQGRTIARLCVIMVEEYDVDRMLCVRTSRGSWAELRTSIGGPETNTGAGAGLNP